MITEQQQEQAARFALGELDIAEHQHFAAEVRANPELREQIRVGVRALEAGSHQAREGQAGFGDEVRLPNARPAHHSVAAEILFGNAGERRSVQRTRKWCNVTFIRIGPAHRAEDIIFVGQAVVYP